MNTQWMLGLGLLIVILTGCSATRSGGSENVPWSLNGYELGRVAMLIEVDRVGPERTRNEKAVEVEEVVHTALAMLPATSPTDVDVLLPSLDPTQPTSAASDYELILAAREHGIDTIGTLKVDRYFGSFGIAVLPPGWYAQTRVAYRLRLLDVATGKVLTDQQRYRNTGGYLGFTRRAYLSRDLHDDLTQLFASAPDKIDLTP